MNNLLKTQHLAEKHVCYQQKCLWEAKDINLSGPIVQRQQKLKGPARGKFAEVFESDKNAGQCQQKAQYHRNAIVSLCSINSKIYEGNA